MRNDVDERADRADGWEGIGWGSFVLVVCPSVVDTYSALASRLACVVTEADEQRGSMEAWVNPVEQVCLAVLKKPPGRVRAKIGELNHRRELTVDKKWRFDNTVNIGPFRPVVVEPPHESREMVSRRRVVVLHQKPGATLTLGNEIRVESSNDLFEGVTKELLGRTAIRRLSLVRLRRGRCRSKNQLRPPSHAPWLEGPARVRWMYTSVLR